MSPAAPRRDTPYALPAAIVSWCVLILATLVMFALQQTPATPAVDPAEQLVPPSQDFSLAGRLAVGAGQLGGMSRYADEFLDDLRAQADHPADRVRAVIVEAELVDHAQARERLGELLGEQEHWPGLLLEQTLLIQAIYEGNFTYEQIPEADRQALIAHHHWFGELALSHADDAPDELREQVLARAQRTVWTAGGLAVGLIALGVGGLILFIVAIVLSTTGMLRWRYRRPRSRSVPFLESMALFLAIMASTSVVGMMLRDTPWQPLGNMLGLLSQPVLLLVLGWPLLRGVDFRRWWTGLGLHTGRGFFRELGMGLVGYVAGVPILVAGFILTTIIIAWMPEPPTHPIADELPQAGPMQLLLIFLLAAVWAPIIEELSFRGAFHHAMRRWVGMIVTSVFVGLVFAAIHPQGIAAIPVLTSIAVVFALVREWRGTIIAPMAGHAAHNFAVTVVALLML